MAKPIGKAAANPLRFVARGCKTSEDGKARTLTANPKVIDGSVTRAWQDVCKGNVEDADTKVVAFMEKVQEDDTQEERVPNGGDEHKDGLRKGLRMPGRRLEAWMGGSRRN